MSILQIEKIFKKIMNSFFRPRLMFLLIVFSTIILMGFRNSMSSQTDIIYEVTLRMENLKPERSAVYVAIFQNSDTFLGENRFKSVKIDNPGETSVSKIITLPMGTYAIAVFQDLNENEKLDKNFIVIPSEPYSFSNDQVGRFGPPSWDEAKVSIKKDTVLSFNF